ncbi:DUF1259 domain-containing protein [Nocardiopsis sp. NPDC006832]|uniref:DUF1259 domain-containing protein n=1 Tax=Nocardiopsis sp. NPDC006832 TaxID=3157188 RepID=UPI0033C80D37
MITHHSRSKAALALGLVVVLSACSAGQADQQQQDQQSSEALVEPATTQAQDWAQVADALGREGQLSDDTVYRVGFPRSDLDVTSRGVQIGAGFALGSYAAFTRYEDGTTMMMGDLVVTEEELPGVTDALQDNGIDQTAVHQHLLDHEPAVWWTHFHAHGQDAAALARGVDEALEATATPREAQDGPSQELDLDTAAVDEAMGTQGRAQGGVYKFSFARTGQVTSGDHVLPSGMGVATVINFQPTGGGKAAVNGDFVMTADEVQGVIQALREGGIDIVALHNHALNDQPRLFYMHFWANDDAATLARALRNAVDQHQVEPTG